MVNVLDEIHRRSEGKITRPDAIQLLIQAKLGQLKLEAGDGEELSFIKSKVKKLLNLTDEDLVAHALSFFLGGFNTTATFMQAMSFELANNPEIQHVLIKEVDEMMETLDGEMISYDQLNKMKFLEMVIFECLRKWPSFRALTRVCTKDCRFVDEETGKKFTIKKDTDVWIPLVEIQMNPKHFPNPTKFDPYRFSDENKDSIKVGTFLPFGAGPRMCIGSRYALLEAKLLLFKLLAKFSIEKCDRTPEKFSPNKGVTGYDEEVSVILKLR